MKRIALFIVLSLCGTASRASPDITFHGFLTEPPTCVVSGGKIIEVQFVDVVIDDISGENYKQQVPYSVTCDADNTDSSIKMMLTWKGAQTDFNDAAVQTDVTGLGVEFQQGGQRFRQNVPLEISKDNLPTLYTVLVKKSGVELTEGDFEAYATLQVDYQ